MEIGIYISISLVYSVFAFQDLYKTFQNSIERWRSYHGKGKRKHGTVQRVQAVCPKQAIIPLETVNKKGYEIIRIEQESCIGCGICYKVCPDYVFSVE